MLQDSKYSEVRLDSGSRVDSRISQELWEVLRRRLLLAEERRLLGAGVAHRILLLAWLAQGCGLTSAGPCESEEGTWPASVVSGQELASRLGLSRAGVHKHVERLRSSGFTVDPIVGVGYRLARPFCDLVAAEAVLFHLFIEPPAGWVRALNGDSAALVGLPYRHLGHCGSTNLVLKSIADSVPGGTTVITDRQLAGRGRLERGWLSQASRDLTFSVLLRPSLAPACAPLLSIAAALAVAEVVEGVRGLEGRVQIKWPNDVLVDGKKVCGILLEGAMDVDRLEWAIVGIGLNVNSDPEVLLAEGSRRRPTEWQGRPLPTSLRAQVGRALGRAPLLARLLGRLDACWGLLGQQGGAEVLLEEVRKRDMLLGREVEVSMGHVGEAAGLVGEAAGIGPEGQLLVRIAGGTVVPVFAGDVTIRAYRP